jgi:hypothetical protein
VTIPYILQFLFYREDHMGMSVRRAEKEEERKASASCVSCPRVKPLHRECFTQGKVSVSHRAWNK